MFIFFIISLYSVKYSKINTNEYLIPFLKISFFMFFYQLGYFYKINIENKYKINNEIFLVVIIVIQIILLKIEPNISYEAFRMKFNTKIEIIPILASITGILFWMKIAEIVQPIFKENKLINFISANTSDIMYHHLFWIFILNTIIYFITTILKIPVFNIEMYKNNIYYFCTFGVIQFQIVYTIIAIAGPLITRYIYQIIKLKIIEHINKEKIKKRKFLEDKKNLSKESIKV